MSRLTRAIEPELLACFLQKPEITDQKQSIDFDIVLDEAAKIVAVNRTDSASLPTTVVDCLNTELSAIDGLKLNPRKSIKPKGQASDPQPKPEDRTFTLRVQFTPAESGDAPPMPPKKGPAIRP